MGGLKFILVVKPKSLFKVGMPVLHGNFYVRAYCVILRVVACALCRQLHMYCSYYCNQKAFSLIDSVWSRSVGGYFDQTISLCVIAIYAVIIMCHELAELITEEATVILT